MNGASCIDITKASYYSETPKSSGKFFRQLLTTHQILEVPSSAIQSENIAPDHKTVAMIRGRNHLTLEITDQVSASFLHTLLGVMMDAQ